MEMLHTNILPERTKELPQENNFANLPDIGSNAYEGRKRLPTLQTLVQ